MKWNPLTWWLEILQHAHADPEDHLDETPPEERIPPPDPPPPEIVDTAVDSIEDLKPWRLRSVGAWTGYGSFVSEATMVRDLTFAAKIGLSRLDVIVNDHSGDRSPRDFGTYNKAKIIAFCQRAVQQGFSVHLMSWCMPHEGYIRDLGRQLTDLAGQCKADSIQLDAEEPWTLARHPMNWEEAGELMAEVIGVPFGVTGIGYASSSKLGPLVRRAQYMVPQCYTTSGNTLNPLTAAPKLVGMWEHKFGKRDVVVGLAGYRQLSKDGGPPRPGYTKETFMTAAFNAAQSVEPTDIVYWSLRHIRSSRSTVNVIAKLSQAAQKRVS